MTVRSRAKAYSELMVYEFEIALESTKFRRSPKAVIYLGPSHT